MWREGASSYVIESMDKSAIPYMLHVSIMWLLYRGMH